MKMKPPKQMSWHLCCLFLFLLSANAQLLLDSQQQQMMLLLAEVSRLSGALESAKPSLDSIDVLGRDVLKKWDDSIKPSVDEVVNLGHGALAKVDDTLAFAKNTMIPVIIVAATVWVAMCIMGTVACYVLGRRYSSRSSKGRAAGSASTPIPSAKIYCDDSNKMYSAFRGMVPTAATSYSIIMRQ